MTSFRNAPPERLIESGDDSLKTLRALAQRYRDAEDTLSASRIETIIGTTAVDQTETIASDDAVA